jgi:hypothetical protein
MAIKTTSEVCTEICTGRTFPAILAHLNRMVEPNPCNHVLRYGRSWDRTSDLPRVKRALSR